MSHNPPLDPTQYNFGTCSTLDVYDGMIARRDPWSHRGPVYDDLVLRAWPEFAKADFTPSIPAPRFPENVTVSEGDPMMLVFVLVPTLLVVWRLFSWLCIGLWFKDHFS